MTVRPTLLIGYGAYGRTALKRLLTTAALRGRLRWSGGEAGEERRLMDLAAVYLPAPEDDDTADRDAGSAALELMRDLDRQILETIAVEAPGPHAGTAQSDGSSFIERVEAEADRLLSAAARARRDDALPLGLDVILLARPDRPEMVGRLDRLLLPVVESLGGQKILGRGPGGAEKLAFIQIFDFEDYWHQGPRARRVREALTASVARWRERAGAKEPAFGRTFLIDGRTTSGVKFAKDRLDETVLFLELLLFEGQRGGALQRLYQRRRDDESPVATFGVRVFERSSGLLSRLAAADFAIGWLEFLDAAPKTAESTSRVEALLRPLQGEGLRRRLGLDGLEDLTRRAAESMTAELSSLDPGADDWPERIDTACKATEETLQRNLDLELHRLMSKESEQPLSLSTELSRAADDDLAATEEDGATRNHAPLSAGALLEILDTWRWSVFDDGPDAPDPAPDSEGISTFRTDASALHDRFRNFLDDRLSVDGLGSFWPLWAIAVAATATPQILDLWRQVPAPDPNDAHHLWVWAYEIVDRGAVPWLVALILGLLVGALGHLVLRPRLERSVVRGRRFFTDPERGRFASFLRLETDRNTAGTGRLRAPLERAAATAADDRAAGARGRLLRQIDRLRRRLQERRRETAWLRDQLAELLRIHGLSSGSTAGDDTLLRHGSGVRVAAETRGDLRRLSATNPPGPERYRSMQSSERPFAGWRRSEAGIFLRPLDFLDRLSRRFSLPESAEQGPGEAEMSRFLDRCRELDLSFAWHSSDDVPTDEQLCLAARPILLTPGVGRRLGEHGVSDERRHEIDDPDRVYLLRVQLAVPPRRLLGRAES